MRGAVPLANLVVIEPVAFGLRKHAGEVELHQQFMTTRERYIQAFETGDKTAVRWVIDFLIGCGTFDKLAPCMRDYIVATAPTHYLDMRSGFDPPLSAHADLHLPMLVLRGERTHPTLARSAEILSGAVPNGSLVTGPGANHFMIATHAESVATLVSNHVVRTVSPV